MGQMRKTDIHEILRISASSHDQNQTRELVGTLMTESNVYAFNSYNSRDVFKNALISELTSPRTRLCPAVLGSYSNDAEKCIEALYGLARLIRKSRGPPSILSPSTSASISRPASAFASAAPTPAPAPTFTPAPTYAPATATAAATATATAPAMASFNYNFDMITPPTTITPSMTTAATPKEATEPSTPDEDTKIWIPDKIIWFRDLTNNPFSTLEFHLSDLVGIPMLQTAQLLESTWVDSSVLLFIRFANALSHGLQVPIFDLTKIEIWMRIEDPINKTSYDITAPANEGDMQELEHAFHTIMDEAMENAFNGFLPLEDSLDFYEITRSVFLGE
jgi:hypothetical protein